MRRDRISEEKKKTIMEKEHDLAKESFKKWHKNEEYIILDTETTGLGDDEVIELCAIDMNGNILVDKKFNPIKEINPKASEVNKLYKENLINEKSWKEDSKEILEVLRKYKVLAYNDKFDVRMIKNTCKIHKIECPEINSECVMRAYSKYKQSKNFISLEKAVKAEKISNSQNHRAYDDCVLVLRLINKVVE